MKYNIEIQCVDKNPVVVEDEITKEMVKMRYIFWVSQIINEPNHYKAVRVRDSAGELIYTHNNKIQSPLQQSNTL